MKTFIIYLCGAFGGFCFAKAIEAVKNIRRLKDERIDSLQDDGYFHSDGLCDRLDCETCSVYRKERK